MNTSVHTDSRSCLAGSGHVSFEKLLAAPLARVQTETWLGNEKAGEEEEVKEEDYFQHPTSVQPWTTIGREAVCRFNQPDIEVRIELGSQFTASMNLALELSGAPDLEISSQSEPSLINKLQPITHHLPMQTAFRGMLAFIARFSIHP